MSGRAHGLLVVEDNEINRQIALELLDGAGLVVDVAENGERAVHQVQHASYDIVLMDVQMPVMDGLEATRRIRALPGYGRLPILAMTANAMAGDRELALEAGMNDHVTKPIDPDQLFNALRRWLPHRAAQVASEPAVAASAAPTTPVVLGDSLNIAGLDVADGLRRVMGKRDMYTRLLRAFVSGQARVTRGDPWGACRKSSIRRGARGPHAQGPSRYDRRRGAKPSSGRRGGRDPPGRLVRGSRKTPRCAPAGPPCTGDGADQVVACGETARAGCSRRCERPPDDRSRSRPTPQPGRCGVG